MHIFLLLISTVLQLLRGVGRARTAFVIRSRKFPVEREADSDKGLGPTYLLRGTVPIRIATVTSSALSHPQGVGLPTKQAVADDFMDSVRDEYWVVCTDGLSVGERTSFVLERRRLGGANPEYGAIEIALPESLKGRYRFTTRVIEAERLLTPAVIESLVAVTNAGAIDRLELDAGGSIRVRLGRGLFASVATPILIGIALRALVEPLRLAGRREWRAR